MAGRAAWCVLASLLVSGWACAQPAPASRAPDVLMDTSPRLTRADFLQIQRVVQFAYDTWLTRRQAEGLFAGLLAEWARSDAAERSQMLDFAAAASSLGGLALASRDSFRAQLRAAMQEAAKAGRPLGTALEVIASGVSTVLRQSDPKVTRHEALAWVEIQEIALSALAGSECRFPDELATEAVRLGVADRPRDLDGADRLLAPIRTAVAAEPQAKLAALRERLREKVPGTQPPPGGRRFEDPLGLYEVDLPEGYTASVSPAWLGGRAFASTAHPGRVIALSVAPVPPDIDSGVTPVSATLSDLLRAAGDYPELGPRARHHALGASVLAEKEGRRLLVLRLRAPGDTALLTLLAFCPSGESRAMTADVGLVLGTLSFAPPTWAAAVGWEAAEGEARANETAQIAGQREVRETAAEALGLFAFRALGAPVGASGLPVAEMMTLVGCSGEMSFMDCPGAPSGEGGAR